MGLKFSSFISLAGVLFLSFFILGCTPEVQPVLLIEKTWPDNFNEAESVLMPGEESVIYLTHEEIYTKFWQLNLTTFDLKFISASKGEPLNLTISPQGDNLFYLEDEILYLLNINSGFLQKIDTQVTVPSWSPYGEMIVYCQNNDKLKKVLINSENQALASQEIFSGQIYQPQFLNKHTLIFALFSEDRYNLVKFNINQLTEPEIIKELDVTNIDNLDLIKEL